ncbi:MAG: RNA polymerase sigma factor [Saprospiraceae bacterium]
MASFLEVYEKHQHLVFNLCLNYLQNKHDAEEAAQDVFVKIHQKMIDFREKASYKTWIYRITVNHCLDILRSRQRQKRFGFLLSFFDERNESHTEFPDFDHPGVLLEDRESLQILFGKINQLPENQRTALILKHLDDLPQREIAEIMQVSEKAVESLLMRAKSNLNKKLNNV